MDSSVRGLGGMASSCFFSFYSALLSVYVKVSATTAPLSTRDTMEWRPGRSSAPWWVNEATVSSLYCLLQTLWVQMNFYLFKLLLSVSSCCIMLTDSVALGFRLGSTQGYLEKQVMYSWPFKLGGITPPGVHSLENTGTLCLLRASTGTLVRPSQVPFCLLLWDLLRKQGFYLLNQRFPKNGCGDVPRYTARFPIKFNFSYTVKQTMLASHRGLQLPSAART